MNKPMVYMETGVWGLVCGGNEDDIVWVGPGWYEALPDGKDLRRDVEMIVFKEDTEPAYIGLCREYGPTFDSFREMTRYLQGHDPDTASVSLQSEGPSAACSDRETRYYPPLQPGSQTHAQHPLHLEPSHDWSVLSCGESIDTRKGGLDDSSSQPSRY